MKLYIFQELFCGQRAYFNDEAILKRFVKDFKHQMIEEDSSSINEGEDYIVTEIDIPLNFTFKEWNESYDDTLTHYFNIDY